MFRLTMLCDPAYQNDNVTYITGENNDVKREQQRVSGRSYSPAACAGQPFRETNRNDMDFAAKGAGDLASP